MKTATHGDLISIAEFKNLAKQGRVGKAAKGDKAKAEMWQVIQKFANEGDCQKEHKFCEDRKFKFDFSILRLEPGAIMIGIEYEGLMSEKSGHTTVTGYTSNCEKYNLACVLGWRVLRYTALNYKDLERDLNKLISK